MSAFVDLKQHVTKFDPLHINDMDCGQGPNDSVSVWVQLKSKITEIPVEIVDGGPLVI